MAITKVVDGWTWIRIRFGYTTPLRRVPLNLTDRSRVRRQSRKWEYMRKTYSQPVSATAAKPSTLFPLSVRAAKMDLVWFSLYLQHYIYFGNRIYNRNHTSLINCFSHFHGNVFFFLFSLVLTFFDFPFCQSIFILIRNKIKVAYLCLITENNYAYGRHTLTHI